LKSNWSPVLTLKSTLISLQSLLTDPQPDDPQDAQGKFFPAILPALSRAHAICFLYGTVAGHYKRDKASFDETARQWAVQYAGAPGGPGEASTSGEQSKAEQAGLAQRDVEKFVSLGFDETTVSHNSSDTTATSRMGTDRCTNDAR
jgi:ubiquitin-conjugating enzyme (huntingtin interacting protein 2)